MTNTVETTRLAQLEAEIRTAQLSEFEIGSRLVEIDQNGWYEQGGYTSIGSYAAAEFDLSPSQTTRTMNAAKVRAILEADGFDELPANEAQARELWKVFDEGGRDRLIETWTRVVFNFGSERITAKRIKEVGFEVLHYRDEDEEEDEGEGEADTEIEAAADTDDEAERHDTEANGESHVQDSKPTPRFAIPVPRITPTPPSNDSDSRSYRIVGSATADQTAISDLESRLGVSVRLRNGSADFEFETGDLLAGTLSVIGGWIDDRSPDSVELAITAA